MTYIGTELGQLLNQEMIVFCKGHILFVHFRTMTIRCKLSAHRGYVQQRRTCDGKYEVSHQFQCQTYIFKKAEELNQIRCFDICKRTIKNLQQ